MARRHCELSPKLYKRDFAAVTSELPRLKRPTRWLQAPDYPVRIAICGQRFANMLVVLDEVESILSRRVERHALRGPLRWAGV